MPRCAKSPWYVPGGVKESPFLDPVRRLIGNPTQSSVFPVCFAIKDEESVFDPLTLSDVSEIDLRLEKLAKSGEKFVP